MALASQLTGHHKDANTSGMHFSQGMDVCAGKEEDGDNLTFRVLRAITLVTEFVLDVHYVTSATAWYAGGGGCYNCDS
jgi:hypothetical protein